MRVLLLSRPGDFGVLEDVWEDHPLILPVWGQPLILRLQAFFRSLGIEQIRILCGDGPTLSSNSTRLREFLKNKDGPESFFSMRSFSPTLSLNEILADQRLFWKDEETLVWRAPVLPLEPIVGPNPPGGFPATPLSAFGPKLVAAGRLEPWTGTPIASLAGPRDFFQTHMRLLAVAPPGPTPLHGVDSKAVLIPPLALAGRIQAKADSHIGPHAVLCPGVRLDPQANLSRVLVLQPVRVGRGLQLDGQIVIGNTLVGPEGSLTVVEDPHLLKPL